MFVSTCPLQPLLVLALEEYFQTPSIDVLERLFDSLNSIDTSAMPQLTRAEKHILRSSERRDLFEEKFRAVSKAAGPPSASLMGPGATARDRAASVAFGKKLGLNEDDEDDLNGDYASGSRSASAGGGPADAQVTSAVSTSPPTSFSPPKHPSSSPPRTRLQSSSSHLSLASSFVTSNNEHPSSRSPTPSMVPIQPTTPYQQRTPYQPQTPTLGGFGIGPPPPGKGKKISKDTHYFETEAWSRGIKVPIRVPLGTFDEEVGDVSRSIHPPLVHRCYPC